MKYCSQKKILPQNAPNDPNALNDPNELNDPK